MSTVSSCNTAPSSAAGTTANHSGSPAAILFTGYAKVSLPTNPPTSHHRPPQPQPTLQLERQMLLPPQTLRPSIRFQTIETPDFKWWTTFAQRVNTSSFGNDHHHPMTEPSTLNSLAQKSLSPKGTRRIPRLASSCKSPVPIPIAILEEEEPLSLAGKGDGRGVARVIEEGAAVLGEGDVGGSK